MGLTPTYAHQDALGSVIALTDGTGAVIRQTGYEPFGSLRGSSGVASQWGFTGRPRDAESGLVFLRNRYYDAGTGRFLTQDPIGVAGGINLYAYVRNDPLNLIDPFGHSELKKDERGIVELSLLEDPSFNGILTALGVSEGLQFLRGLGVAGRLAFTSAAERLAANRAAGLAAEAQVAEELAAQGNTILGQQVSAITSAGRRVVDLLIQRPDGSLVAVEVKSGGAVRNALQALKDMLMATEGGTFVGKNAPDLIRGTTQVVETIVETR